MDYDPRSTRRRSGDIQEAFPSRTLLGHLDQYRRRACTDIVESVCKHLTPPVLEDIVIVGQRPKPRTEDHLFILVKMLRYNAKEHVVRSSRSV
jgi:hypothetical protein